MKLHKFIGANSRDVMRQVREALGEDALIVSNRSVPGGIEVVAARDSEAGDPGPAPSPAPATGSTAAPRQDSYLAMRSARAYGDAAGVALEPQGDADIALPGGETGRPAACAGAAHTGPRPPAAAAGSPLAQPLPQGPDVQAALDALRGSLESRMDGLLWSQGREPVNAGLFRALLEAGFSMPLVRALLQRLPAQLDASQARDWARNELLTHLPVLRNEEDFLAQGGVIALVGPTGVGKTTTLAKLAARCVAREGRDQVAMLTTDNFRIGALEQLQIYGRLMGVPAHSVRDAAELRAALAALGSRKLILIDTTGISQRDRQVAEQAALLCAAAQPVRRLLVLNAASQGDTLDEVAHAYRHGGGEDVVGCIITKLDEATRLGPALDTAIRHRLPIHYLSHGQKVPEHLAVAQAQPLVDHALAPLQPGRALYAPSEADLAALWRSQAQDEQRQRQLLAAAIAPAGAQGAEGVDEALDWLARDPACKQGRLLWRSMAGVPAAEAARAQVLAMLQREFPAQCRRYLLAMHGKASLKGEGLPGGVLHATLMMSDRGAALAAPAQHLMLPHGTLSTFGSAMGQDQPAPALLARAAWLHEAMPQVPQVQMLDMGAAALAQGLNEAGRLWVARCAGGLRIVQDDCPTTLNAVARNLGYVPAGALADGQALWASGTEVQLPARAAEGAVLRLVAARVVDAAGEIRAQYYGLSNLATAQADAATIAGWLVQYERAKAALRYLGHAWAALPRTPPALDAMRTQAVLAGQLAAACWQLSQAEGARAPLAGLIGPAERSMPSRLLPVALLKMYALLEMAQGAA